MIPKEEQTEMAVKDGLVSSSGTLGSDDDRQAQNADGIA
jgi:hypothetical protein